VSNESCGSGIGSSSRSRYFDDVVIAPGERSDSRGKKGGKKGGKGEQMVARGGLVWIGLGWVGFGGLGRGDGEGEGGESEEGTRKESREQMCQWPRKRDEERVNPRRCFLRKLSPADASLVVRGFKELRPQDSMRGSKSISKGRDGTVSHFWPTLSFDSHARARISVPSNCLPGIRMAILRGLFFFIAGYVPAEKPMLFYRVKVKSRPKRLPCKKLL
jgi:hypothetical protein